MTNEKVLLSDVILRNLNVFISDFDREGNGKTENNNSPHCKSTFCNSYPT